MSMRYRYVTPDPAKPGETTVVFVDVPVEVREQGPRALQAFHLEQLAKYPEPAQPEEQSEVATDVKH